MRAEVYAGIAADFANNYLDESELIRRGEDRPYVTAVVTKSKIAALAALDEVLEIDQYGVPASATGQGGGAEPAASDKITSGLLEEINDLSNDALVRILVTLKAPSYTEIDATVPFPEDPTSPEQVEAYASAILKTRAEVYAGIAADFANNYLDESELIHRGEDLPYVTAVVTKSKIASLAALDEVLAVDKYGVPVSGTGEEPEQPCEHDYADVVTAPTCTEGGYTTYTCSKCGDSYQGDETEAQGHDFQDGVCTRCGAKDPDYVPPVVDPFRFDDVKDDALFYYEPVYWAVEQKITKGTSEKLFSPNGSCTRAQVVTFLWRAAGEPEPAETLNPFQDVKADAYYYKAVLWAVEQGVTKGTSADAFSPEATCTRAQIVTFLYRANGAPEVSRKSKPFRDVDEGQYYADAVAWAVENGVTTGKSADTFAPNATCTRGEVVTFLYRAAK